MISVSGPEEARTTREEFHIRVHTETKEDTSLVVEWTRRHGIHGKWQRPRSLHNMHPQARDYPENANKWIVYFNELTKAEAILLALELKGR